MSKELGIWSLFEPITSMSKEENLGSLLLSNIHHAIDINEENSCINP